MPRTVDLSRYGADDLAHVVRELIARKKVSSAEVHQLAGRQGRIAELERQIAALRGDGVARGPGRPRKEAAPKRAFTMTPKARAARKLQGQYLGTIRALSAGQKNEIKALVKKEGVASGLKLALKYKAEAKKDGA